MSCHSYSVTSNNSHLRIRRIECLCGLESPLCTSWTSENPGRRFHGCGFYKLQGTSCFAAMLFQLQGKKSCNFFDWFDEPMTERAKEVIMSLMKRIYEFKKKDNVKKKCDDEMTLKLKRMKGFLALSWLLIIVLLVIVMLK
uniref:Uncharacterized protein LOC101512886 n=1 Tax=Cicer arietinum TaxID=3827 RepID=A0A1S2XFN5_CICAR|nr:uncharacterized protein LOC101512886 [Cicer arietinum]